MTALPTLTTARCTLEAFSEAHLGSRYVSWLNDPEVVRYSEQRHRAHDLNSCRAYLKSFDGTPHYFAAIIGHTPNLGHIGNINAYVDEKNGVADIGIMVGEKSAWGQGYGAEAWQALSDFLLIEKGLRKITAGTLANNQGMLKIMQKTGMTEDGRRLKQMLWNGQEIDVVYAARFRPNA